MEYNIIKSDNIIVYDKGGIMQQDIAEIVMNPIRLRIVQYLAVHKLGTVAQIRAELSDIPQASLYRHIKVLAEADFIKVVKETKLRGTVEKTYALSSGAAVGGNADPSTAIQGALLSLFASFRSYFANAENDPQKDMLTFGTSTLMLSDEEFADFLMSIGKLIGNAIQNPPNEQRKPRRFTVISSPNEEK